MCRGYSYLKISKTEICLGLISKNSKIVYIATQFLYSFHILQITLLNSYSLLNHHFHSLHYDYLVSVTGSSKIIHSFYIWSITELSGSLILPTCKTKDSRKESNIDIISNKISKQNKQYCK